jgi:AraC-like DNA-binding protein
VAEKLEAKHRGATWLAARKVEYGDSIDPAEVCYERGWTDGLPVTPPTDERIIAMLKGTTRKPDEFVGRIPPNLSECTVEKVAINAVMAGCKPEYMPVLLAAIEAALEPVFTLHGVLATTYFSAPVMTRQKMESVATLLGVFADHLAIQSNQIAVQQASAEPPVIARAKRFIEDHHRDDLSLGQVAASVHTSLFYFCKLFKRHTGVSFTEYVSRLRTEKAKKLLLNLNLRVSEIAYEVGFQSLTHFNRVFKRILHESPSEYRARLQAA